MGDVRRIDGGRVAAGSALLSVGVVLRQAFGLARNVLLARILSPDDFGLAAAILVTITFIGQSTDLGVGVLVVQSRNGDRPGFQRAAQFAQALRGLLSGAILFAAAPYIAGLFSQPEATWAFRCVAAVPVILGFQHLDPRRFVRDVRFGPQVTMEISASIAAFLAAIPLALIFRDYRAVVVVALVQSATTAAVSHLLAERRYRWTFESGALRQIAIFGWPLMLNGLVMFALSNGDRLLIGSAKVLAGPDSFDLADLGVYAAAATLATAVPLALGRVLSNVGMPILSQRMRRTGDIRDEYLAYIRMAGLVGAAVAGPTLVLASPLIHNLYGESYAPGVIVLQVLAIVQLAWLMRASTVTTALALGDSRMPLIVNVVRLSALTLGPVALLGGLGIGAIASVMGVGELLGIGTAFLRLNRRHGLPLRASLETFACIGGMVAVLGFGIDAALGADAFLLRGFASLCLGAAPLAILFVAIAPARRVAVDRLLIGVHAASRMLGRQRPTATHCERRSETRAPAHGEIALDLIAMVNRPEILEANLAASPMLSAGRARLLVEYGAGCAGEAYNRALERSSAPIQVLAHQDVYLPRGWDERLRAQIEVLEQKDPEWGVIGLFGATPAGQLIGRSWSSGMGRELGRPLPSAESVHSIDEMVIVLNGRAGLRFDEQLPSFHLYATDIVLRGLERGHGAYVIDNPVVHNSVPVLGVDPGFVAAYRYMQDKWAERLPVPTCCVHLRQGDEALMRYFAHLLIRSSRRKMRPADAPLPCAPEIARELGYEQP